MKRISVLIAACFLLFLSLFMPVSSEASCVSDCDSPKPLYPIDGDFSFLKTVGSIQVAQAVLDPTEMDEQEDEGTGTEVDTQDVKDEYDSILLEAAKYANKDNGAASSAKEWDVILTIYLWLSGLNGNISQGATNADLDVSFGDIWENFDVGGQLHLELWWKRWFLFLDPSYQKLTMNNSQTKISGTQKSSSQVGLFQFDIAGGYRVAEVPLSKSPHKTNGHLWPKLNVDIYGGGRIYNADSKVRFTIDTPAGPDRQTLNRDKSWFDFIVGTRFLFNLTEDLVLDTKTDIGGFGLGFSSDISWNFAVNLGYELPWMGLTPYIGYRTLYVNYEDGKGDNRFKYDIWQTGPQIGLGIEF